MNADSQSPNHTAGNWRVQRPLGILSAQIVSDVRTTPIALVFARPYIQPEDIANANLIAAAPELLACLEAIVKLPYTKELLVSLQMGIGRQLPIKCLLDAIDTINKAKGIAHDRS